MTGPYLTAVPAARRIATLNPEINEVAGFVADDFYEADWKYRIGFVEVLCQQTVKAMAGLPAERQAEMARLTRDTVTHLLEELPALSIDCPYSALVILLSSNESWRRAADEYIQGMLIETLTTLLALFPGILTLIPSTKPTH